MQWLSYVMLLVLGIIWGATFSLARIATDSGAHPIGLAFWQAAGGGSLLLVVCMLRRCWPRLNRANLVRFCIIGFLGTALPSTLYFYAAAKVPVGILSITVALVPILTYAASGLLGLDSFSRSRLLGILLGFVAILLLVLPDGSLPQRSMLGWLALGLVATVFYTIENIYVDKYIPQRTNMTVLLTGAMYAAALMLLPLLYHQQAFVPLGFPLTRVDYAILLLMSVSSLAYLMYLYVIKTAGAVFASMAGYVITLSGVLWGMLIFAEQHSLWVWSSLLLILLGVGLVTPRRAGGGLSSDQ